MGGLMGAEGGRQDLRRFRFSENGCNTINDIYSFYEHHIVL